MATGERAPSASNTAMEKNECGDTVAERLEAERDQRQQGDDRSDPEERCAVGYELRDARSILRCARDLHDEDDPEHDPDDSEPKREEPGSRAQFVTQRKLYRKPDGVDKKSQ